MQPSAIRSGEVTTRAAISVQGANERRFDRRSRRVLVLALLLLFVGAGQKVYRLSLPTLGWTLTEQMNPAQRVFGQNLLGKPSPLQPGDQLIVVERRNFGGHSGSFLPTAQDLAPVPSSETLELTVLRQNEQLRLEVPLYHWTPSALLSALRLSLQENYASWLALLVAAYLFWQRPKNSAAQLLLLIFITKLVIDISWLVSPVSVADLRFPLAWLAAVFFSHLSFVLVLAPLVLHLCLSFPEPKPFLLERPWLLWLIYGTPWLISLVELLFPLNGFGLKNSLFLVSGIYPLLGAVAFAHTFATVSDPVRRAQVRWVTFGFGVSSLAWVVWALAALGLVTSSLTDTVGGPSELMLALCLAVALLRYRLFDIDLVINRGLVYGALSACVISLYILIVGGLGALLGAQGNLFLALVGTGLVAVLFQPLRERLQTLVNRLMYGQRDEPYALIARLSRTVEETLTPEAILPTLLKTVTQALKVPYASVLLYRDEGEELVAEHGKQSDARQPVVFLLVHQGETFGELQLEPRAHDQTFALTEMQLLKTITQQVSVAAYAVRQTLDLRRSKERLITTREEERLRIRRDLHDGLGPTLAGLNLQAGSLERLIADDPRAAQTALDELRRDLRSAAGEVRQLVHDLRPPSLDQLGFRGALEQLIYSFNASEERMEPCVRLDLPVLPSLTPATEVALYRITQEALTNAVKHAQATQLIVSVRTGMGLELTIQDDGIGVPEGYRAGVGLRSMRERAEELGGCFMLESSPEQGTEIRAHFPYKGAI